MMRLFRQIGHRSRALVLFDNLVAYIEATLEEGYLGENRISRKPGYT